LYENVGILAISAGGQRLRKIKTGKWRIKQKHKFAKTEKTEKWKREKEKRKSMNSIRISFEKTFLQCIDTIHL
jgi:hypothetical protein